MYLLRTPYEYLWIMQMYTIFLSHFRYNIPLSLRVCTITMLRFIIGYYWLYSPPKVLLGRGSPQSLSGSSIGSNSLIGYYWLYSPPKRAIRKRFSSVTIRVLYRVKQPHGSLPETFCPRTLSLKDRL